MLNDLKDLEKAIKLCRKLGVSAIKIGDVEFHLGSDPKGAQTARQTNVAPAQMGKIASNLGEIDEHTKIEVAGELTQEQLLFGSSDPAVWEAAETQ